MGFTESIRGFRTEMTVEGWSALESRAWLGKTKCFAGMFFLDIHLSQLFLFPPGCPYVTVSSPIVLLPWFLNHRATVVKSANQTELQNLCAEINPPDVYIATEN